MPVTIPAVGTGDTTPDVASDDCGAAGEAQIMKLAIATVGSATLIPADATAGMLVDPSDDALRDNGKVDVASLDQYTPVSGRLPVDGSGVTSPVSAASLPLPTGASTAAKQPALGTAGTASTDVISVQGIAAMTPVLSAGVVAHDGANTAANNPPVRGAEAIAHGANPTAVAAADVTKTYASRAGIPFVHNGHPNVKCGVYLTTGAQTDDAVTAAIAAGTKYVVVGYGARASSANTVSTSLILGFGATTLPALGASGDAVVEGLFEYHPGIVAGSGVECAACYLPGGDGEEVRITCSAPTGGSLAVKLYYITIES